MNGVLGIILVLTLALPTADLEVKGSPKDASVRLEGKKVHHPSGARRYASESRKQRSQSTKPINLCLSGDTVNSCGEPRSDADAPSGGGTVLTPGMAAEAVREVAMPSLKLRVQPDGQTLVNVDTIFFVEPAPFETSIDLLDVTVDIEATAVRFTWVHGDGTKQTTAQPGRAYPSKDVTHRYQRPGTVPARVDTTYAVRFAIDGGDWIALDEHLTASGESTTVEVREALPVLVH